MNNANLIESLEYHTNRLNEVSIGLVNKTAKKVAGSRLLKAMGTALNPFKSTAAKHNSLGRAIRAGALKQMKVGSGKMSANKVVNAAKNSAPARLDKVTKSVAMAANAGSKKATNIAKRGLLANSIGNKPSTAVNNLINRYK